MTQIKVPQNGNSAIAQYRRRICGTEKSGGCAFPASEKEHPFRITCRGVFIAIIREGEVILSGVSIAIKNINAITKRVEDKKKGAEKVLKAVSADARKRVPGWVATEVTKEYGVKKSEITGENVGTVTVKGTDVRTMKVIYSGRLLTHTHFSMSPKVPKEGGGYTLKASVLKGQRKTLGNVKKLSKAQRAALAKNFTGSGTQSSQRSPIMLMRANGGQYLPFQRKSANRNDIEAVKTISLPQMVSSDRTKVAIRTAIDEGLQKRVEHHMKRYGMK